MKYSQFIGIIAAIVCIIASAWLPWVTLGDITWTGLKTGPVFRAPAKLHIFLCALSIICFLVPKMTFKLANLILTGINLAWALRNFLGMWRSNDKPAPTLEYGIYILFFASFAMILLCLTAKIKVKEA
jgi:hypothetical protein